jgi:hypothetical protein
MLSRSTGTRNLIPKYNSNSASTISNASSVNINAAPANGNMNKRASTINFPSFIAKTLLPIEEMETFVIKADDMAYLKQGSITDNMIERIKLKPVIVHAGSRVNKFWGTQKYTASKRLIFKVCLIDKESYADFGSKSGKYAKIGEIDRNSELMNALTPGEVKFVNVIYNLNRTIPLNMIGNSSSDSSLAGIIPAAGNIISRIFAGGRKTRKARKTRKVRKTAKKSSRRHRKHKTRKH